MKQNEAISLCEASKQALEALAASDDFLFNYHDCEPNNEREMDAYSEIRANNHEAFMALRTAIAEAERKEHAERLSLKGWQYFECPACGSEGARAFPQPEQEASRPIYIAEVTMPDPDEIGPWCDGTSWCLNCHHEWVAVWPLGAESLECPACGSTDTDRDQAEPHERKTK